MSKEKDHVGEFSKAKSDKYSSSVRNAAKL